MISILVPIYNSNKNITRLFECFKRQTCKDFEVIFVDNNSTDDSLNKLKLLCENNKQFRVYNEISSGPMYARKKAFELSKGEYICFCDSDDVLADNAIEIWKSVIEKYHADIYIGDYKEISIDYEKIMKGLVGQSTDTNLYCHKDIYQCKPALWNKCFKKSLIKDFFFLYTKTAEDLVFCTLSLLFAESVYYINKIVYLYKVSQNGLSFNNDGQYTDVLQSLYYLLKKIKEYGLYDVNKEEIDFILYSHALYRLMRLCIEKKEIKKRYYSVYINFIKNIDININNIYLKKKFYFKLSDIILTKSFFYYNPIIVLAVKLIFKNKQIHKIFRKLDV
ncbi:glycosyltransferase family 2 protein [[Clostridium] innocuum]|nr:glycosyltransferase family 2 protein [[Clostridium] innocuum]